MMGKTICHSERSEESPATKGRSFGLRPQDDRLLVSRNAQETDPFSLPFEEASEWFRRKLNIPTSRWDELSAAAHVRAFASAGATQADLLADLRAMTDKAIAGQMDIREFRRQFLPLVEKYGWSLRGGGPGWRADLIFSQNIQNAYQAGRWEQFEESGVEWLKYVHLEGQLRPRPHHVALHGTVLPRTDPFWDVNWPPNGFRCKCRVVPADREEIRAAGGRPKRPEGWENAPDKGFDHNVGNRDIRHEDVLGRKLASLPPEISGPLLDKLRASAFARENDAAFARWIDRLLSDGNKAPNGKVKLRGEMKVLWFVDDDVATQFERLSGTRLETRLITITDRKAYHSLHLRDVISGKGRPIDRIITEQDLKKLPAYIRDPQAVLYEKNHKALIYAFPVSNAGKRGLWAVHVHTMDNADRILTNSVRSGSYIDLSELNKSGTPYVKLKGNL